jgi:hypothetical protein
LVWVALDGGATLAQGTTTTTPTDKKVFTNPPTYYLVPAGTYTVPAGATGVTVEYDYGVVNAMGQDGPGQGIICAIPGLVAGANKPWKGADVAADPGITCWVKSRVRYTLNGVPVAAGNWVRGQVFIKP